jgi:hypothetical protein
MNAGPEEPIKPVTAGNQLDKVLECLGSINERLDSIETEDKKREDAAKKRRRDDDDEDTLQHKLKAMDDAIESGDPDQIAKAHAALKEHLHDDDDSVKRKDAKRRRHDDEGEDREYDGPKKVVADSVTRDNRRREALLNIQSRADSVSQALLNQDAPAPMQGERVSDYRRRMLRPFLAYSAPFRNVDLNAIDDGPVFDGMEQTVFKDAMAAASDRDALNASAIGQLRRVVKRDDAGRNIVEYFGQPRMWLDQFACPVKRVACINNGSRQVRPSEIIG